MKVVFPFLIIVLIVVSVGCSPQPEAIDIPTTDNMVMQSIEKSEEDDLDKDLTLQVYTVEDMKAEEFLSNYIKVFEDKGWEIKQYNPPGFLKVEKDDEEVTIMPLEKDNKLIVNAVIKKIIND